MRGRSLSCAALVLAYLPLSTAGTDTPIKATAPGLTAKQIVDKNVAARGGSEAWRAVGMLEMKGKLQAAVTTGRACPFRAQRRKLMWSPLAPWNRWNFLS
ncbi:MAG TPA: hypothetical protein VMQ17_00930 [Candidatus Sulfotelmatobacter sp.]|nr:hypothetical protein [Candidatus Sulfotelmatobacter sp.]